MPPENPTESVLDVVNAALGEPAHEEVADTTDDSATDVSVDEGVEGDSAAVDEAGEEGTGEGEADGETEGGEPPAGTVRDPATGKFVKKVAEEPKLDEKGKPAVEPKKADPVNDPIPKDLKPQTQERIRTLISTAKELTVERDRATQDFNYMVQGVQATGASPEQYGETLSWLALFNSGDPAQQEKALELVESVADRLSTLLGKERSVNDPLAAHQDLQAAVKAGQVTSKYAAEIARTRNSHTFRGELTGQARQQQQQQENYQREEAQARTELTSLEQTLAATDPRWESNKQILVAALKPAFETIPPREWPGRFQKAYANLRAQQQAARPAAPRVPANQPLRAGKNPAGGQAKAPGSMMDAVNAALSNLSGK